MCISHDVENETEKTASRNQYRLANSPNYPEKMDFEMGSGVAVDENGVIYLFTRDIEHWAAHPLAMKEKMGRSSVSMFSAGRRKHLTFQEPVSAIHQVVPPTLTEC